MSKIQQIKQKTETDSRDFRYWNNQAILTIFREIKHKSVSSENRII